MMKHKYEGVIFIRFSLHIVITQGRDEEEGDRELMASSDPSAKSCFLRLCCCLHACDREAGVRWNREDELSGKTH